MSGQVETEEASQYGGTIEINAADGEQLVIDDSGLQVYYTGTDHQALGWWELKLRAVNNSDTEWYFGAEDVSINDIIVNHIGDDVTIGPGKTAMPAIQMSPNIFAEIGITEDQISNVEFRCSGAVHNYETDIIQVQWYSDFVRVNY